MLSDVEAVLLTGGASKRMGTPKSDIMVDGTSIGNRTALELASVCQKVTVLGLQPLEGYGFQLDSEEYGGPRRALDQFKPTHSYVFVASCDMPHFQAKIVLLLRDEIGNHDACIPFLEGFRQPLCGLYKQQVIGRQIQGESSMMSLLKRVDVQEVDEGKLLSFGLNPRQFLSFNTPVELEARIKAQNNLPPL